MGQMPIGSLTHWAFLELLSRWPQGLSLHFPAVGNTVPEQNSILGTILLAYSRNILGISPAEALSLCSATNGLCRCLKTWHLHNMDCWPMTNLHCNIPWSLLWWNNKNDPGHELLQAGPWDQPASCLKGPAAFVGHWDNLVLQLPTTNQVFGPVTN